MAAKAAKKKGKAKATFDLDLVINPDKLTWHGMIGEGGCGEVHKVEHEDWGWLAVKKLGVPMVDER